MRHFVVFIALTLFFVTSSMAMDNHADHASQTKSAVEDHSKLVDHDHDKAATTQKDHINMDMSFKKNVVTEGVRGEFEVMSLASMNIKDPDGNTHHIMAKFFHDKMNHQIKELAGKVKIISPSKKEQVQTFKNYSGVFAANCTFSEKGKYGVISLIKLEGKKYIYKFWYDHK